MGSSPLVAALDIGGTKTSAALVDIDNRILARTVGPTPATVGSDATLDSAVRLVRELVERCDARVRAVGVGTAGVVDRASGRILSSTDAISGWAGTDVGDELRRRLGLLVAVDNDVHAHLLGELTAGVAVGKATVLLVAVGTGVGGSIAVGGRIHRGRGQVAGHLGHVPSPSAAGVPCPCGVTGHVEAVASGPALVRVYNERSDQIAGELAEVLARAATGTDPVASEVIRYGGTEIGHLIGGLINVLDPDLVVVTGGVSASGRDWWAAMLGAAEGDVLPPVRAAGPIDQLVVASLLGADASLIGAAQLARDVTA